MSSQPIHLNRTTYPQPPSLIAARYDAIHALYTHAASDRLGFWETQAKQLHWQEPWHTVCSWQRPISRWFDGGKLNASENCLDRHLPTKKNKPALIWESETGHTRTITYGELTEKVARLARSLQTRCGVKKGDRVTLYLPLVPEAVMAMLACSRIGAIHSVVFAGFSAPSLRDRIIDSASCCLITSQTASRRGKQIPLRAIVQEATNGHCPSLQHIITLENDPDTPWQPGDHRFSDCCDEQVEQAPASAMDSENPLFILYTSGTTGKPKGIVHTTGGYLTQATCSTQWVFDLQDTDIFWCTADVGWITGHSYLVYGPLANGATLFMYEGTPDYPHYGRFWELIERHRISIFYTAPTAIRSFMKWGDSIPKRYTLDSLRLLGSVGEPINPEAWQWYHRVIGTSRCPIVDTWWQTETGGIMLCSLPGYHPMKPGIAGAPLPGLAIDVLDASGNAVKNQRGLLGITAPWPAMCRGIWGDQDRFYEVYWQQFDAYAAGDGAFVDDDGDIGVIGRVDDVLNVAGHRLGTMEIESALVAHPTLAEAAVVGMKDPLKGDAIAAFVILNDNEKSSPAHIQTLIDHVKTHISPIAKPALLLCVADLPKTRSGKIMRRLLKKLVNQEAIGDTTTLASPEIIAIIQEKLKASSR